MTLQIKPAKTEDLIPLRALLAHGGLVQGDLTPAHLAHFIVARAADGPELLGAAGLELCGRSGLLRSVVLASKARGKGLGRGLVAVVEHYARSRGLAELWLLTTTAPEFFARLDYRRADRADAPAEIQGSAEFASLCPASAVCMFKYL